MLNKNDFKHFIDFIITNYYQTVWDDFKTDKDIWDSFIKSASNELITSLVDELNNLSQFPSLELLKFINEINPCGGLYFTDPVECRNWLCNFTQYMHP